MKHISFLFFIVLILTLWPRRIITDNEDTDINSDTIINKACEAAPYKDLCTASIKDDCESPNVEDLHNAARIAVNAAYLNASETQDYMQELLHKATEAFMQQSLMDCTATYDDAIGNLEDAVAEFQSKGYSNIAKWVETAMVDPKTCEDYFNDVPGHTSPLTIRNTMLIQLCSNALAITKLVEAQKVN